MCVRSGVTTIEHGHGADAETFKVGRSPSLLTIFVGYPSIPPQCPIFHFSVSQEMKEKSVVWIPSLTAYINVVHSLETRIEHHKARLRAADPTQTAQLLHEARHFAFERTMAQTNLESMKEAIQLALSAKVQIGK